MSKHPTRQQRNLARDRRGDAAFWKGQRAKDQKAGKLSPTSAATYDRAIARAEAEAARAEGKS